MEFSIVRNIVKSYKHELDEIDLTSFKPFSSLWNVPSDDFYELAGEKVYRILIKTSFVFNEKKFIVVGQNQSTTSMALGLNDTNQVICFNKNDVHSKYIKQKNINFIFEDVFDPKFKETILDSTIVFMEVQYDGEDEKKLFNYLVDINYKGLVFINGIYLNNIVNDFWGSINKEKYDLTIIGCNTGTGMVNFH